MTNLPRQYGTAVRGDRHNFGAVTRTRVTKGWWVYLENNDTFGFYKTKKGAIEDCRRYNIIVN